VGGFDLPGITPLTSNPVGMLLLAAWSTNGWLPSGHAMRMALDLGLHRALDKLAEEGGKHRSEEEQRDLGMFPAINFSYVLTDLFLQLFLLAFGFAYIGLIISKF
jgi:hypothetical protein